MPGRAGTARTARLLRERFGERPFSVAQAAAAGVSYDRLRQARDAGRVVVLRRGVVMVPAEGAGTASGRRGAPALDSLGAADRAWLEGCVTATPAAVVSGRWAAELLGLPVVLGPGADRRRRPPLLLLPSGAPGKQGRRRDGALVRRARLTQAEVVLVEGIAVTSPLRTALELARHLPTRFAVASLDAALHQAFPTASRGDLEALAQSREMLEAALGRQSGTVGIARAREAGRLADARSESPLESVSRLVAIEGGLPAPEPQWRLRGVYGEEFWGDLGWPRYRLVGECDGWGKYGDSATDMRSAFQAEKRRHDSLQMAGYRPLHWGWDEGVVRPRRLLTLLGAALAAAGWDGERVAA